ncbi:MAG: MFS transporter [Nitrospirota bacterium]
MANIIKAIKSGHPPTLLSAFLYFDVSFMIWVLIGALGIFISGDLGLTPAQKGTLVAIPLLGGAFFRVVVGVLVDRFGPKKIGILTLTLSILPLILGWLWADHFISLLVVGLLLGVAGSSFAVALPLASRCYPPEHQGVAMGIAGSGNSGSMIAILIAPFLAKWLGWHAVFGLALIPLLIVLSIFVLLARELGVLPPPMPLSDYITLLKKRDLWWFNLYYGVTFGSYVGLASFLGIFLHDQYGLSPVSAGGIVALSVFAGSAVRPMGGYWADRIGGVKLLMALYLIVTIVFGVIATLPPVWLAVALFFIGMSLLGMGNGAVFQWIPQKFPQDIGLVTGLVGAAGGVGGFFLPTLLGSIKGLTGSYGVGFLICASITLFCFVSLFFRIKSEKKDAVEVQVKGEGRVRVEVGFGG